MTRGCLNIQYHDGSLFESPRGAGSSKISWSKDHLADMAGHLNLVSGLRCPGRRVIDASRDLEISQIKLKSCYIICKMYKQVIASIFKLFECGDV
jgi:hypothetical protein